MAILILTRKLFGIPVTELMRYALVGLALNSIGYLIYLLVTSLGAGPIVTVTFFYPLSIIVGYFGHRRHTFKLLAESLEGMSFVRYVLVYVAGYIINVFLLSIFHYEMGFSHQIVQLIAIFIVAAFLFITMKIFVFQKKEP